MTGPGTGPTLRHGDGTPWRGLPDRRTLQTAPPADVLAQLEQLERGASVRDLWTRDLSALRALLDGRPELARMDNRRVRRAQTLFKHPTFPELLSWRHDPAAWPVAQALWDHLWEMAAYAAYPETPPVPGEIAFRPLLVGPANYHNHWWIARLQLERPPEPAWEFHQQWQHWAVAEVLDGLSSTQATFPTPRPQPAWAGLSLQGQEHLLTLLADPTVDLTRARVTAPDLAIARLEVAGLAFHGSALQRWGERLSDPETPLPPGFWALASFGPLLAHLLTQPREVLAPFLRWPSRPWRTALIAALGRHPDAGGVPPKGPEATDSSPHGRRR